MVSHRWWTIGDYEWLNLIYWPYTLMCLCYMTIGMMLAPIIRWDIYTITVICLFLGIGIIAHCLDEVRGHPLGTKIPDKQLYRVAGLCSIIVFIIAVYLTLFYYSWIIIFYGLAMFFVIVYNAEVNNGMFHRDMVFIFTFAFSPMFFGYITMSQALPKLDELIFMAGIAGAAGIETVVNHYVKFSSKNSHLAYDKEFSYLQRAIWACLWIVYLLALSLLLKRIING